MIQAIKAKDQERNPERLLQLKRICDMLLAAGYFRARVPVLSPFDKVVGGLVWGITASNVDLDVDIIFKENSTIGERVRLSEQIVKALVRMKCPHPLQPQQIQGLDYPPLFKATKWLVSRVIEIRAETQSRMRQQAEFNFDKTLRFPSDSMEAGSEYMARVLSANPPVRKYKKQDGAHISSLLASAEATLLEYGERFYSSASFADPKENKKKSKNDASSTDPNFEKMRSKLESAQGGRPKGKEDKGEAKKSEEEEMKRQNELKNQLDELGEGTGVSASGAGSLILDNAEQIKQAIKQYEEESQKASLDVTGKQGLHAQFRRLEAALLRQIDDLKSQVQGIKPDYQAAKSALGASKKAKEDQDAKLKRLKEVISEQEDQESKVENKSMLDKLKGLVAVNEMLKNQEAAFKQSCLEQKKEWERKLKSLQTGADDDQTRRMLEIERLYDKDLTKYNKLRGLLSKKNLQIARVTRQIDAIPTRAELLQYQRRFVELYELVSNKLVETRKYFELYNMLEEKHRYMVNEVELLNAISKSVPKLMTSSSGQEQLGQKFDSIIKGMLGSQGQVERRFQSEKTKCDLLADKHKKLLQKQRSYFQAVKEFQEECVKNEKLQGAIEMLEPEQDQGE
ncbi:hypothetical protein AAMO2058_000135300 [Amorphochlora amoebiformis]